MTVRIRHHEIENRHGVLILYHRTSQEGANAIMREGFRNARGFYGMGERVGSVAWAEHRSSTCSSNAMGQGAC